MKPEEVWLLYRAHEDGYARVLRASESEEVRRHGKDSYLGYLWMRNFLDALED